MKKYKLTAEIINLIMFFVVLVVSAECLRLFLYERVSASSDMFFSVSLEIFVLLGVFLSYFVREYVTSLWVYMLLHLPVPVLLWFLGSTNYARVVGLLILVLLFIADMVYWRTQPPVSFSWFHPLLVLIPVGFFAVSYSFEGEIAREIAIFGSIVYFLLYYLRIFFENASRLSQTAMGTDNSAFSKMIRGNLWMAIPVIFVLFVSMVVIDTKVFADKLSKLAEGIVKWFLGLLRFEEIPDVSFDVSENYSTNNPMEDLTQDTAPWITTLYNVIFIIVAVIILSLLVFIVVKLLKQFLEEFGKREIVRFEQYEDIPGVYKETIEKITKEKKENKNIEGSSIRKRYKKQIRGLMKRGYNIDLTHTPSERAIDVYEKKKTDIFELTEEYQQERYR